VKIYLLDTLESIPTAPLNTLYLGRRFVASIPSSNHSLLYCKHRRPHSLFRQVFRCMKESPCFLTAQCHIVNTAGVTQILVQMQTTHSSNALISVRFLRAILGQGESIRVGYAPPASSSHYKIVLFYSEISVINVLRPFLRRSY
jgi:hypothetical protein